MVDCSHRFPALVALLKSKERNQGTTGRKQEEKPVSVKQGSVTGTIYTRTKNVDGKAYTGYRAGYYGPGGKRVMTDCGDLNRAQGILREAVQAFGRSRPDAYLGSGQFR